MEAGLDFSQPILDLHRVPEEIAQQNFERSVNFVFASALVGFTDVAGEEAGALRRLCDRAERFYGVEGGGQQKGKDSWENEISFE